MFSLALSRERERVRKEIHLAENAIGERLGRQFTITCLIGELSAPSFILSSIKKIARASSFRFDVIFFSYNFCLYYTTIIIGERKFNPF